MRTERQNPKASIAFVLFYPFQFFIFKNVYQYLSEDAEFVVDLGIYFPTHQPASLENDIVALLEKQGVYYRILNYQDYLDPSYLEKFYKKYKAFVSTWIRGCMLLPGAASIPKIHMPYGVGKELTTFGLWKKEFDLILAYGNYDDKFYSLITRSHIIGNPKFDDWFLQRIDNETREKVNNWKKKEKNTVLYLPTHSDLSSIHELADELKALSSSYNIVVKLHYITAREELEAVRALVHPNILLFQDDTDLLSLLRESDVVLSDNSSAIFDALLADRPVLATAFHSADYLDTRHRDVRTYRRGKAAALTFSGSIEQRIKTDGTIETIHEASQLNDALQTVLNGGLSQRSRRKKLIDDLFAYQDGQSGARGAQAIREFLDEKTHAERPFISLAIDHYVRHLSLLGKLNFSANMSVNEGIKFTSPLEGGELAGWFPNENAEIIAKLIRQYDIKSVIEVGCFVGLATVFFASKVERVIAIDTFDALEREKYLNEAQKSAANNQLETFKKNTKGFDNITILQMSSDEAAALDIEADLVYIDASHDYQSVQTDIAKWYPKTKKILCGDDYTVHWDSVRLAVDECGLEINKDQRVWYHVKK